MIQIDPDSSVELQLESLPVRAVVPELLEALADRHEAVLEAPPGAGKSTLVPLVFLDSPWLRGQRIIVLEPRRLAARQVAARLAENLGEALGQTVGYRIRLERKESKQTRILVVTEGVLTRMLQQDPSLEGVGLVIFDEFHERSLDADLTLALCLYGRELFRDDALPLKLLPMSATLDGDGVARLLSNAKGEPAPRITSEGRQYPIDYHYLSKPSKVECDFDQLERSIARALSETEGGCLVFLPGVGEIHRLADRLLDSARLDVSVVLYKLYGDLPLEEQRQILQPEVAGKRKLVLATAIAETSLTVPGITSVVDSGLARLTRFDPRTSLTRLHTERVSRDASDQRAGRAGRLGPGVCYRLWSETQQQQLSAQRSPEITRTDLSSLLLLLAAWGVECVDELKWLDRPAPGSVSQAAELLNELGALQISPAEGVHLGGLTALGEALIGLPCEPRIGVMLLVGKILSVGAEVCALAAVLSDRDPMGRSNNCNLLDRLDLLAPGKSKGRLKRQQQQFERMLERIDLNGLTAWPVFAHINSEKGVSSALSLDEKLACALALAFPDRIAKKSAQAQQYQLSSGRGVSCDDHRLSNHDYLVATDVGGSAGRTRDRIFLAVPLPAELFEGPLKPLLAVSERYDFSESGGLIEIEQLGLGKLVLSEQRRSCDHSDTDVFIQAIVSRVRHQGLSVLGQSDYFDSMRLRCQWLYSEQPDLGLPSLSDQDLIETLEHWLVPVLGTLCQGVSRLQLSLLNQFDWRQAMAYLLDWQATQSLDDWAPERFALPTGTRVRINYAPEQGPTISARLQEFYGLKLHPTIAEGRVNLMVELLSPARRPIQLTADLPNFWQGSYSDVKKDMKGRYPKHLWPDDPANTEPTTRVKSRQ